MVIISVKYFPEFEYTAFYPGYKMLKTSGNGT